METDKEEQTWRQKKGREGERRDRRHVGWVHVIPTKTPPWGYSNVAPSQTMEYLNAATEYAY